MSDRPTPEAPTVTAPAPALRTRLPHTESEVRERIIKAIGGAAACWDNPSGAGTFKADDAGRIAAGLMDDVLRLTELGEPHLGCATTRELAEELAARMQDTSSAHPHYRTVRED